MQQKGKPRSIGKIAEKALEYATNNVMTWSDVNHKEGEG
jgi:hypothetical protein